MPHDRLISDDCQNTPAGNDCRKEAKKTCRMGCSQNVSFNG